MAVLKGVHERSGLLRAAIASAGNDHRLGANEAPPAIISAFLGDQLTRVLDSIEKGERGGAGNMASISLGVSKLPEVAKDNNRNALRRSRSPATSSSSGPSRRRLRSPHRSRSERGGGGRAGRVRGESRPHGQGRRSDAASVVEAVVATKAIRWGQQLSGLVDGPASGAPNLHHGGWPAVNRGAGF